MLLNIKWCRLVSLLILGIFSAISELSQAQYASQIRNRCSGKISDLNCYQDSLNQLAHQMNVHDGFVEPREEDYAPRNLQKTVYEGRKIIVDIQDQDSCNEVARSLQSRQIFKAEKSRLNLNQLCKPDPKTPNERYRTVTLMWETNEEYLTPLNLQFLTSTDKNLVTDTRNLSYLMLATLGLLWVLPESVSKWDKDEIRRDGFLSKWRQNVSGRPVVDKDDALINYLGHPIAGAIYYNVARSNGLSKMQSFGYSVLMSTFFWEYGVEAIAERPSIQDLIVTPVLGSIMGEFFYQWTEKIKNNDGKVLGSKKIGSVLLFVLNPADKLSSAINKGLGKKFIQSAESNLVLAKRSDVGHPGYRYNYIGVQLLFKF